MLRLLLGALTALCLTDIAGAQSSRVCAGCHRTVWDTYQRTGMGRSFYRPSPGKTIGDFTKNNTYFHKPSNTYFTMLERDGKYFQRRYQLDSSGKQVNVMEKQIDYVMGSGNHARTYLNRTKANTLIELPLGWYAEQGGYRAMNPGYDRPNHDGFRRPITYDCMFCHNAYPRIPAGHDQPLAEAVYADPLPEGIDCQRCHGDGARHVQLAGAGGKPEEIRGSILNPARLTAERQMEACMVCHLETTSFPLPNAIQRFGRSAFSYRPGEPLSEFLLNFDHAPGTGREDKFEIVSAAYRLRRSACFLKSNGKMLCTTCHNPHDVPHEEEANRHYTAVCRECHAEAFDRLVKAGKHATANSCVECHMPKRRTEDVIHVSVTDHFIQRRKPDAGLLAERTERQDAYRGRVVPYYPETLPHTPENELMLAVAQVIQGSNLTEGIAQLTAAIEKYKPERAEYYLQLAEALQRSGQLGKSIPMYREAVRRNPKAATGLQKLGTALRQAKQYAEAEQVLQRATSVEPDRAVTWHELGLTYSSLGKGADAATALGKALELDPDLPEAHNNLGILWLSQGNQARAEAAFREAIRIRPDYADARGNLAGLLSAAGKFGQAGEEFETALRLRPADAPTRFNYATMLGRTGHYEQAQQQLEESLRTDPNFSDAHVLLGDMLMARNQARDAAPHYREAVRITPESIRANFGLGAALAASGDFEGAIPHLKKAAAGADTSIRDQAADILRQIERRR